MKKMLFLILLLFCFLFIPNKSYAEEWYKGQAGCSYSDINKLRTLASAIKFEVKFLGNKRNNEYGVQISNVSNDLEVYFNDTKLDTSKIFDDLYPSTYLTFTIKVSKKNACVDLLEISKKINIPAHNYYYDEELCEGASDLDVCDPNYDSSQITETEFKQKIEIYKNSTSSKEKENKFLEFSKKYWYVYLIAAALITIGIFIIINKRKRGSIK